MRKRHCVAISDHRGCSDDAPRSCTTDAQDHARGALVARIIAKRQAAFADANREESNGERTRACPHAPRNAGSRGGGLRSGCVWQFGEGAGSAKNLRARAWLMAWWVVLAPSERPARETGSQGVRAHVDRARRALAPARREGQPDDPHHRRRQRHQMGATDQCRFVWPLLRRLPGVGRPRADRFSRLLNRLSRLFPARQWRQHPREGQSARRGSHPSGGREEAAQPAAAAASFFQVNEADRAWSTACARRSRSARTRRSWY